MPKINLFAALLSTFVLAATSIAQEFEAPRTKTTTTREEDWYYQPSQPQQPSARTIVQEKARFRSHQRMARMAALEWYGFSNSRPRANPTPFGSMYSSVWAMPGGRPYAWYPTSQPVIIMR